MSLYVAFQIISLSALVVKYSCKGTQFCMVILARKSVKYVSERIALHGAESISTVPNDVLSEKFTVFLSSVLQQLKAKNLSPNCHA